MAFKAKSKEFKPKQDCKDFKPKFWDKEHCKLSNKCENAGIEYEVDCLLYPPDLCTGIKSSILDNNNPPRGGSGVPNK